MRAYTLAAAATVAAATITAAIILQLNARSRNKLRYKDGII